VYVTHSDSRDIILAARETMKQMNTSHSKCFACGRDNDSGLGLVFEYACDGQVCASCIIDEKYQGYPGVVQGGIVETIFDCAMTNCLFSQGIEAMTVRLNVQYRLPGMVDEVLTADAVLISNRGRMYELEARISQAGKVKAFATGRFMVKRDVV